MTYTNKERERYNHDRDITCKNLEITINDYNWFRRIGQRLHEFYELNCNGELSEKQHDSLTSKFYSLDNKKSKDLGLYIYFQTDPRGATIYLDKEPIPENNYTRASCIY